MPASTRDADLVGLDVHSLMYSANAFSTKFLATSVNIISPDCNSFNRLHFGWLLSARIFWVFWFSACFCWSMLIVCCRLVFSFLSLAVSVY